MSDQIPKKGLRPKFWEKLALAKMTDAEWEEKASVFSALVAEAGL